MELSPETPIVLDEVRSSHQSKLAVLPEACWSHRTSPWCWRCLLTAQFAACWGMRPMSLRNLDGCRRRFAWNLKLEVSGHSLTNMPTVLKLLRPLLRFARLCKQSGLDFRILTLQQQIRKPLAEVPGRFHLLRLGKQKGLKCYCPDVVSRKPVPFVLIVGTQQAATFHKVLFVGSCFRKEGLGLLAERGTVLAGCS